MRKPIPDFDLKEMQKVTALAVKHRTGVDDMAEINVGALLSMIEELLRLREDEKLLDCVQVRLLEIVPPTGVDGDDDWAVRDYPDESWFLGKTVREAIAASRNPSAANTGRRHAP